MALGAKPMLRNAHAQRLSARHLLAPVRKGECLEALETVRSERGDLGLEAPALGGAGPPHGEAKGEPLARTAVRERCRRALGRDPPRPMRESAEREAGIQSCPHLHRARAQGALALGPRAPGGERLAEDGAPARTLASRERRREGRASLQDPRKESAPDAECAALESTRAVNLRAVCFLAQLDPRRTPAGPLEPGATERPMPRELSYFPKKKRKRKGKEKT
jgi:hypothetical protein